MTYVEAIREHDEREYGGCSRSWFLMCLALCEARDDSRSFCWWPQAVADRWRTFEQESEWHERRQDEGRPYLRDGLPT